MSFLFIADLHLGEDTPELATLFEAFLAHWRGKVEGLYILGDLFEAWIGDDDDTPFHRRILAAMREFSTQTPLFVVHGNRDFLLGSRFAQASGAVLLPEHVQHVFDGQPALLLHGDTLCTDDLAYQRYRRRLRQPWRLWMLRHLPLVWRRRIAQRLRAASQTQSVSPQAVPSWMDVNEESVRRAFEQARVRWMIHGHTHRPARHQHLVRERVCERWVLPDWRGAVGGYVLWDGAGLSMWSMQMDAGVLTCWRPSLAG